MLCNLFFFDMRKDAFGPARGVDDLRRMDKISSGTLEACATLKLPPHPRRILHAFLIKARLSVCLGFGGR